MSYRLKQRETLADGLRRIASERLEHASDALVRIDREADEAVHTLRKDMKKVRAVLRLVRDALRDRYQEENACFRDCARALSGARDATVAVDTLDELADHYQEQAKVATFRSARAVLSEQQAVLIDRDALLAEAERVRGTLQSALARVADWPLERPAGFDLVASGLERTYARGRDALSAAADDPQGEQVHEWRKRCKYLWYHMRILRDCWKRPLKGLVKELDGLGDLLGAHHDLVELRRQIHAIDAEDLGGRRDQDVLLAFIDRRGAELLQVAWPIGRRIWCEKPKRFTARIRAYWEQWTTT
ncbi:MAG: CHAD domain-containing protein [Planctomycetota bacterium]